MEDYEKPNRLGEYFVAAAIVLILVVAVDAIVTALDGCRPVESKDKVMIMGRDEGTIEQYCGGGDYRVKKQNGGVLVTLNESEFVRINNGG